MSRTSRAIRRPLVLLAAIGLLVGLVAAGKAISAPEPPRDDTQPHDLLVAEGVIRAKEIRSLKGHPRMRFSANTGEADGQRAMAAEDRYRAEFTVDVDSWAQGSGPQRIVVVRGVAFPDLRPTVQASSDWSSRAPFDAIKVGLRYRFALVEDDWFKGNYYKLAVDSPELVGASTVRVDGP
jgi:hypothetical protein